MNPTGQTQGGGDVTSFTWTKGRTDAEQGRFAYNAFSISRVVFNASRYSSVFMTRGDVGDNIRVAAVI
jgi:hypothetical protein